MVAVCLPLEQRLCWQWRWLGLRCDLYPFAVDYAPIVLLSWPEHHKELLLFMSSPVATSKKNIGT